MSNDEGRPERIEFHLEEGRQEFARRKNRASSLRTATKARTNPLDKHPTAAMYNAGKSLKDHTWRILKKERDVVQFLAWAVLLYIIVLNFL